jgi:membrane-bound metal-dependent hydrolase YbcI (DUF457 family)
MATTYTHAVVGLEIAQLYTPGRKRWLYWLLAAFLAVFPDFDAFSSAAYGAILGHRGFTHTLVFSLWLALQSELLWVWLPTGVFISLLVLLRSVRNRRLAVCEAGPLNDIESQ